MRAAHRHRRLAPRAGTLPAGARKHSRRARDPLSRQRGRHRRHGGARRAGSRNHVGRRRLEELQDPRDAPQRATGEELVSRTHLQPEGVRQALPGGNREHAGGARVRPAGGQLPRCWGFNGRALLAVVGGGAAGRRRPWPRRLRGLAGRRASGRSPLPGCAPRCEPAAAARPAAGVEHQLRRRGDSCRARLRPPPALTAELPPAVGDGEQRQVGAARRRTDRHAHCAGGLGW